MAQTGGGLPILDAPGHHVRGEFINHTAIGVWYNPRQCFCQRYEAKLIGDPGLPESGRRPSNPACVRCSLKYFWNSRSFASRSAVVQNNVRSKHSLLRVPTSRSTKGCDSGTYGTVLISITPNTRRFACHWWNRYNGSLSVLRYFGNACP